MQSPPDPFAAGLFPVCPSTHDLGIRWLFDLATILLLLDCRPGDRVLDVGAGSGFSSEMMARLGYHVIAIDPDRNALSNNRKRPSFDPTRIQGSVHVAQAIAERLSLSDQTFDGILGMNVLHHIPDLAAVTSEFARVLKPGCRAVFCEPGLDHLEHPETKRAISEHGENDRPFDVLAFLRAARSRGFSAAMLSATLQPPLRLLPIEEVDLYVSGNHPRSYLTPTGVIDELQRRHAYAMLVREGTRPKTSRHPGVLKCEIDVEGLPKQINRVTTEPLKIVVRARNTGDSVWLAKPSVLGGYVTAGCKVLTAEGRLVTDAIGRTHLQGDVGPNEKTTVTMSLDLSQTLDSGVYVLHFDMVDELVCWFSDLSPDSGYTTQISVE